MTTYRISRGGTVTFRAAPSDEEYLHVNAWEAPEVEITVVGVAGQKSLGGAPASGSRLRIREITIRHVGTNATVVTLLEGTSVKLSIDVPAQTTQQWSSQNGRLFTAQPVIQTSDVTGGTTRVSGAGVEALPS